MARDGTEALQRALYALLDGEVYGTESTPVPVRDHVPQDLPKPYIVIGGADVRDFDTKDSDGTESTLEIDVYTEYRGRRESKLIAEGVYALLHHAALAVDDQQCVLVRFDHATHVTEADGLTRRSTLRYVALLSHT